MKKTRSIKSRDTIPLNIIFRELRKRETRLAVFIVMNKEIEFIQFGFIKEAQIAGVIKMFIVNNRWGDWWVYVCAVWSPGPHLTK